MAIPFKPKGSADAPVTAPIGAIADDEAAEGESEAMTPGEIGSAIIRAVKAGDGEAVYEMILKCK